MRKSNTWHWNYELDHFEIMGVDLVKIPIMQLLLYIVDAKRERGRDHE